jgi:membrane fusion protein (multidrug efflux system)
LDKTTLRAPFAGKVGITKGHRGSFVSSGMPLVTLQEQGTVKIQFAIAEKYSDAIGVGREISFSTINSNERHTAIITATEAGIEIDSRSITVYATSRNDKKSLTPGMSVRVYFPTTAEHEAGFLLPTQALMPSGNGYSVFTIKNGLAKTTSVEIGNRTDSDALITAGLNEGDTVLISNILRTAEGTPVQVVSAD